MDSALNDIFTFISNQIADGKTNCDGRFLTVYDVDDSMLSKFQSLAMSHQLVYEGDKSELTFDLNNDLLPGTLVFFEKEHFLAEVSYERYKENFDDKTIIIYLNTGKILKKFPGEIFSIESALIFNYIHYRNILNVFLNNTFFTSLHSLSGQQIIILSVKYGSYNIGYKLSENRVESLGNLQQVHTDLIKHFDKVEFVNFFKDVVIDGTHSKQTQEVFWEIITGLSAYLFSADRDYQIYVQTFAFDKIKSKFKEEKIKYFESLEKNIDTLNKQVTAFPLTFAASAFAGFQVKEGWILLVITFAYALYTWVAWNILQITKLNITTTKKDVEKESTKLQNSYKIVYDEFKEDFANIKTKIEKIDNLHSKLKFVLITLLSLFVLFAVLYGRSLNQQNAAILKAKNDSINIVNRAMELKINTNNKPIPVTPAKIDSIPDSTRFHKK